MSSSILRNPSAVIIIQNPLLNLKNFFKMRKATALSGRMLFLRHTSESVPVLHPGVDIFSYTKSLLRSETNLKKQNHAYELRRMLGKSFPWLRCVTVILKKVLVSACCPPMILVWSSTWSVEGGSNLWGFTLRGSSLRPILALKAIWRLV